MIKIGTKQVSGDPGPVLNLRCPGLRAPPHLDPLIDGRRADAEALGKRNAAAGTPDGEAEGFGWGHTPIQSTTSKRLQGDFNLYELGGHAASKALPALMGNAIARLLTRGRLDAGLTLQQAADKLRVTNQAVNQWERGRTTPSQIRARQVCELYGITAEEYAQALREDTSPGFSNAEQPPAPLMSAAQAITNIRSAGSQVVEVAERVALLPLDVPVMGVTVGGDDHDFEFNGATVDHVRRPPGLANARRAYATYVVGQSMYPAFREGAVVYVNPDRPPANGDDVIIELHSEEQSEDLQNRPGKGFIKRLVRRTPTKIVVEQFNPKGEIEFERDHVKSLHRVVPWDELLSI